MYKFNTPIGSFELPSDYNDLTIKQLKFIQDNIDNEALVLSELTGFDVVKLSMLDLSEIGNFLSFMQQPLHEIEPIDFIADVDLSFDFKERSFGDKVKASQCVIEGDVYGALTVYSGITDFDNMNVSEVFGAVNYVVSKLREMDEDRNKMLHFEPTAEEIMAGIHNFDQLGEFNTIDTIAQKYKYTHKEVEELEYNLVILILYRSKISANFEKKLFDVRNKS
jgi:hypothetical protein